MNSETSGVKPAADAPEVMHMEEVLFYRDFQYFTGGHLKVWDYFNHVLHSPNHVPKIRFSERSLWDQSNPWRKSEQHILKSGAAIKPDIIFLEGMDWLTLTEAQRQSSPVPIINLIQHVRHAWPGNPRYAFLKHRAIRICVSEEVAHALKATGWVDGPIFVIPNGLSSESLPEPIPFAKKDLDILVIANKRPRLGQWMTRILWRPGRRVFLLTKMILRPVFLALLNRAKITLFLPNLAEGFYLPALEGMALGTIVVCPDCIGNRSFCHPNWNCFRPDYNLMGIRSVVEAAMRLQESGIETMLANAKQTFSQHSLLKERKAFLDILEDVDQLW